MDKNTTNVIDNLVGLQECLEAGEDWCSVAIIAGAIEFLQSRRAATREWVRMWEEKIEHICNTGEMPDLDTMLKELDVEVVE